MNNTKEPEWHCKWYDALSLDELYGIMRLRQEVFVVEQNCPYLDADGKDKHSLHVFAMNDNQDFLAYGRIVKPGISYREVSLGRIVTSAACRSTGTGKLLMEKLIFYTNLHFGTGDIRISAQSYLKAFYGKFGFRQVSEPYLEDDIPHIEMLRNAGVPT